MDDWYNSSDPPQGQGASSGTGAPYVHGGGGNGFAAQPGEFQPGVGVAGAGRGYAGMGTFTPPTSGHSQGYGQSLGGMRGSVGGSVGYASVSSTGEDYSNEPPLLEELGINFEHIWSKTMAVIVPTKAIDISYLDEPDLAGPLVFCLIFGACLLFTGKVHFGYIYGFGLFGCIATALVLNLLGDKPIDLWKTCSVLGYCLLPLIGLAALGIVLDLRGAGGLALSAGAVLWCSFSATRLFEQYLSMRPQRWLVAYPVALLYTCFVLITIF